MSERHMAVGHGTQCITGRRDGYRGMSGSVVLWLALFPVTPGFLTRFVCNLGAECTTTNEVKQCRLNYLDELAEEDFVWEWTDGFGPSEPTALRYSINRNGDVTDLTLQWRGPDDSSIRDLLGYHIEFEEGDIFHEFVMDLQGNAMVFQMGNATKITYQMVCRYSNPFSEAASLRVYVTSLPKSLDLTDKVVRDNISIFIPKYTSPDLQRDLPTGSLSGAAAAAPEVSGSVPVVIVAVVAASILLLGILLYLKLRGCKSCEKKRNLKAIKKVNLEKADERTENCNYKMDDFLNRKTKLSEETQIKLCQEVCMPFVVEYETMTSFPHCNQCLHHMDSYDSGFHSDYRMSCEDHRGEEETQSEEQPILPASAVVKPPGDIGGHRLPWFHPPQSEGYSMTSLKSEDLEQEILRINRFTVIDDDKG